MPDSVSTIEASAFAGCMGVTIFDFTAFDAAGVPTLANINAFSLTSDSKKIVVRDSAYDAFMASNNWDTDGTNYKIKSCITKQSEA